MLNVIGVGSAYPDGVIHNDELCRMRGGKSFESLFPGCRFKARRTSMPLEFIEQTGPKDIFTIPELAVVSPTQLGVQAVKDALSSAGLAPEQLGIILGDCATPYETTPSEGQRITGGLGLKGISYDVSGASCTTALHLGSISSWKDDRTPDYVVSVSTNTPTHNIDYHNGEEAGYFGDAASAMIVSTRIPGKLRVLAADYTTKPGLPDFLTVDLYGCVRMGERPSHAVVSEWLSSVASKISKLSLPLDEIKVITPPLFEEEVMDTLGRQGFPKENFWNNAEFLGYSLGSHSIGVLAEHWNEINSHSQVLILQIGAGVSFGYVVLSA